MKSGQIAVSLKLRCTQTQRSLQGVAQNLQTHYPSEIYSLQDIFLELNCNKQVRSLLAYSSLPKLQCATTEVLFPILEIPPYSITRSTPPLHFGNIERGRWRSLQRITRLSSSIKAENFFIRENGLLLQIHVTSHLFCKFQSLFF